jgi:hypothetical protein
MDYSSIIPTNPINPTSPVNIITPGKTPPSVPSVNVPKIDDKNIGVLDNLASLKNLVRYRKQIWKNGKLIVDTDDSSNNKPIITNTNIPASNDKRGEGGYGNYDINIPATDPLNNYGNRSYINNSSGRRQVWKNGVLVVDEDLSGKGTNFDSFRNNFGNINSNFGSSFGHNSGNNFDSNFDSNFGSNFGSNFDSNFGNNFGSNFSNFSQTNFGGFSAFDPPKSSTNIKRQVWKNGVLVVDEDTSRDIGRATSALSNNFSTNFDRNLINNSTFEDFNDRFNRMGNFGERRLGFEGLESSNLPRGIGFDNSSGPCSSVQNNFESNFNNFDSRNRNFFMDIRSNRVEDNCNLM